MARPAGLILDYGNVLTRPQDQAWMHAAATRFGADPAAFRVAYWRFRPEYDADLPAARYWERVLTAARAHVDRPPTAAELDWLIERDIESWTDFHEAVWLLAAEFRRAGGRVALLSNSGPEVMARVRAARRLETCFDAVVISCEVGLAKPDPRIYRLCLDRLGLPAGRVLFVDDRADNVAGAAEIGLQTLHFDGADALDRLRARVG